MSQIERDLARTFPRHPYFNQTLKGQGIIKLKRVLMAFASYDSQVDYVQGMNFIVAALLLHCSEVIAFWLFVSLIEDCDLRDIYMPSLPGLFKHSQILELLIQQHIPRLQKHFVDHNIKVELFASEWIFGLFSSVIPVDHMGLFFDEFFKSKWVFFYQLVLQLLHHHKQEIINEEDFYCIIHQIKYQYNEQLGLANVQTFKEHSMLDQS